MGNLKRKEEEAFFQSDELSLDNPVVQELLGHIAHILAKEYVDRMKGAA